MDLRTRILPKAYAQLEYITCNTSQYINTGITTQDNLKVETKFKFTSVSRILFGGRSSVSGGNGITWGFVGGSTGNRLVYNMYGSSNGPSNISVDVIDNQPHILVYSSSVYTIDGITQTQRQTVGPITESNDIYVGTWNSAGTADVRGLVGNLYYFKIWDNNTLVRNFIPALRKYDNTIGMYDTVTETFYTNAGTGAFTAGNVIVTVDEIDIHRDLLVIPPEYQEYEGLTATGSQWLDTGYTPNQDTKVEIQYLVPTVAQNGTLFGSRVSSSSDSFNLWGIIQATVATRFNYGPGASSVPGNTVLPNTKITLVQNKNRNYQDGVELTSNPVGTFDSPHPAYLFNMYSVDGSTFPINGTIYSCKVWENDVLVRNFKPVKRVSDNVCGMWDTVTETFYTNISGSGAFTVSGNQVTQSNDVAKIEVPKIFSNYDILEYLEVNDNISTKAATANAFIDTGITPSGDGYKYEIMFNRKPYPSSASATVGVFGAQNGTAIMCLYDTSGYYNGTSSPGAGRITGLGLGNDTTYVVSAYGNGNSLTYDVNGTTRTVTTNTSFDSTMTKSIHLFKNNNDAAVQPMNGKIYYFKLWKNNTLLLDMIPVKRKSDNAYGMLNLVNNTFYGNAGDGTTPLLGGGTQVIYDTVWTKAPDIPSTYTKKNYLQSSGSQWINSGVTPTQNTKASYTMAVLDNLSGIDSHFFGSRQDASTKAFDLAFMNAGGQGYGVTRFISGTGTNNAETPLVTTATIVNRHEYYMTSSEVKVDGTQIMTFSTSSYTSTYPLWLFGVNNAGTLHGQVRSQKVWGCKIWDSTTLVRDFVPAMRNSDSELGMYDLVTDTFFTNAGSGTFTAG